MRGDYGQTVGDPLVYSTGLGGLVDSLGGDSLLEPSEPTGAALVGSELARVLDHRYGGAYSDDGAYEGGCYGVVGGMGLYVAEQPSPGRPALSSSLPNPSLDQFEGKVFSPQRRYGGYSGRAEGTEGTEGGERGERETKKKSPSRGSVSGIKRPLNSFMLYRRDKQGSIPTNNHQSISRIIGEMWKRETIEEKERYAEMAQRERERHAKEYPDYKFLPRKKKDRAQNGKSPRRRKTYDPVLEQDESKILRMMLSQISHRKSQSEVKTKTEGAGWALDEAAARTGLEGAGLGLGLGLGLGQGLGEPIQVGGEGYGYMKGLGLGLGGRGGVEGTEMYGVVNTCFGGVDRVGCEMHGLVGGYGSVDESLLGSVFGGDGSGFPQGGGICENGRGIDCIDKTETQNMGLLPAFDSTVLQDDMGYVQDSFSGLWDETMDLSSFSANSVEAQEVLRRPFDPVSLGLVNIIKGPQCQEKIHRA
ncbi:hypothetical protein PMAC_002875 [Pneumocystis sp. 'macacae']|nr:hypothetical protein PMAC_002875 [Pneumocystis sp. 'macacae']